MRRDILIPLSLQNEKECFFTNSSMTNTKLLRFYGWLLSKFGFDSLGLHSSVAIISESIGNSVILWVSIWFSRSFLLSKVIGQSLHLITSTLVTLCIVFVWYFKAALEWKNLLQQLYPDPKWMFMCVLRVSGRLKDLSQCSHLKALSSLWVRWCLS